MRNLLLAAGLVVVIAGVLLMWNVRSGGSNQAALSGIEAATAARPAPDLADVPGVDDADAGASARGEPAEVPRPAPPAPGPDEAGAEERPAGPTLEIAAAHAMNVKLGDGVPQRIYDAAATCYRGEPGKGEVMAIDYTLRVSDGVASIEDVAMQHSEWKAPALERCVLAEIAAHTWPEPEMPNMVQKMQMDVSLLGLIKRQQRPPADDDDDEGE